MANNENEQYNQVIHADNVGGELKTHSDEGVTQNIQQDPVTEYVNQGSNDESNQSSQEQNIQVVFDSDYFKKITSNEVKNQLNHFKTEIQQMVKQEVQEMSVKLKAEIQEMVKQEVQEMSVKLKAEIQEMVKQEVQEMSIKLKAEIQEMVKEEILKLIQAFEELKKLIPHHQEG